ncbi:MAG TPA: hypothetical protein DCP85_01315 [Elusimicrobia bacterium]|nr:hypothetical protein [Elusimicrobiota bacterium]
MKTTSILYKAAQASNLIFPVRKVELFRRLASGASWEATPIDVTAEVAGLDRLAWKLDTDALNEFKASNIRIEVDNSKRQWDDGSGARFSGFLRFHSKIRISLGLKVSGVEETFPAFIGVIEDANEDSAAPVLQLDIRSMDQLLENADADKAAVLVTNELLGVGDGVRSEFELSQTPAGIVKEIRVAGVPVRPGIRWTAGGLGDPAKKAKIVFDVLQPASGEEVRADYIVWKRDQQIHQVVNDLLATVPQVEKLTVETVNFSPPAQREILHTTAGDFAQYSLHRAVVLTETSPPEQDAQLSIDPYDSEAEWQAAAAIDKINFKRLPGGIHPRWTAQYEGDLAPNVERFQIDNEATFPWSEFVSQGASASLANSIRTIDYTATSGFYSLFNQKNDVAFPFWSSRSVACRLRVEVLSGTLYIAVPVPGSNIVAAISFQNLNNIRVVTNNGQGPLVAVDATQFHVYRLDLTLTSANAGTYRLYVDGVQKDSGTLGPLSSPPFFAGSVELQATGSSKFHIDFLRLNSITDSPASGGLTLKVDYGPVFSGLAAFSLITTLGPFFAELVDGIAAGAQFFWSWSQDDFTYSAETQVSNGGNVGNWTNVNSPRFIKFRIVVTDQLTSIPYGIKRLWLPAVAVSPKIDGGTGIVSWDTWKAQTVANNGAVQRFTAAEANSLSGFSFHQALGPGDSIQTDEFQNSNGFGITQKMVFISLFNTAGLNPPTLLLNLITLTTANVLITMANMNSRSVLDVLKELARIADFEIGVDGNGKFFFRNKAPAAASALTLNELNVERVQTITPGWDRVFNSIRATFGDFVKVADSASEADPAPTSISRFGVRPLSVGGGNMIFQTDVDLATVMAKRYFGRYKEPKRRATLTARFMPEVELGDRVTFSIPSPRQIGQSFDARVLGVAHDLMSFRTEFDLTEV